MFWTQFFLNFLSDFFFVGNSWSGSFFNFFWRWFCFLFLIGLCSLLSFLRVFVADIWCLSFLPDLFFLFDLLNQLIPIIKWYLDARIFRVHIFFHLLLFFVHLLLSLFLDLSILGPLRLFLSFSPLLWLFQLMLFEHLFPLLLDLRHFFPFLFLRLLSP